MLRKFIFQLLLLLVLLPMPASAQPADGGAGVPLSHPLRPPPTDSPRDTLQSFQDNVRRTAALLLARGDPGEVDRAAVRILRTLDLRHLPPADYVDQGWELAAFLLEILGRLDLPPPESIPGAAEVAATGLERWTIPDTEITIARTPEGPHPGEFQFSAATVRQLGTFHERIRHLPYRPGAVRGFYEAWSYSPGPWLPASWVAALPDVARATLLEQTLWQWAGVVVVFLLAGATIAAGYHASRRWDLAGSENAPRRYRARLVATAGAIGLLELLTRFLDDGINITGHRIASSCSMWRCVSAWRQRPAGSPSWRSTPWARR